MFPKNIDTMYVQKNHVLVTCINPKYRVFLRFVDFRRRNGGQNCSNFGEGIWHANGQGNIASNRVGYRWCFVVAVSFLYRVIPSVYCKQNA